MAASVFTFLIALGLAIGGPNDVVFGLSPAVQIILLIPYVTMALAAVTVMHYLPLMRKSAIGLSGRIGYLTGVMFTWFMAFWQIL